MKKFKMKVIIQSKENPSDSPVTNQFSSGVFTDVNDVLPDLISFLKDTQQNLDIVGDAESVGLDVPKFELPHFDRLLNSDHADKVVPSVSKLTVPNLDNINDGLNSPSVGFDDEDDDVMFKPEFDDTDKSVDLSTSEEQDNGTDLEFDDDDDTNFDF